MNAGLLVPLSWTLLAFLLAGVFALAIKVFTERSASPEANRATGILLVAAVLAVWLAAAACLVAVMRGQSYLSLAIVTGCLAYPALALFGSFAIVAYEQWSARRGTARIGSIVGNFSPFDSIDPIQFGSAAGLKVLFPEAPPPPATAARAGQRRPMDLRLRAIR